MLFAIAQAVPSAPRPAIDLTIPRSCGTQQQDQDDDVIVCGRRDRSSQYRLPPPSPTYETERRKAEHPLGNGTSISAETERVEIGGIPSNRAMIRLKIKF